MLIRTDPFRELDRLTQQLLTPQGTLARPAAMLMDAWREGDSFYVELDLPGVNQDSLDIDVERNVVTVRAERPARASDVELVVAERPRGVFSRQLVLGDNLDTEHIRAGYDSGVLTLQDPGRRARQAAQDRDQQQERGSTGHQRLTVGGEAHAHGPRHPCRRDTQP